MSFRSASRWRYKCKMQRYLHLYPLPVSYVHLAANIKVAYAARYTLKKTILIGIPLQFFSLMHP